ncbi:MAG: NUDIX hydrolase [Planctomycetes bacterium]|nr:NUDIX hydrolase [Planctomycetota bacterium]
MTRRPKPPSARKPALDREEAAFLQRYDASAFPHPSVAVDVALLTADERGLRALVLRRDDHPHRGRWALPGTFVGMDEALDTAAMRALDQKGGLRGVFLEQLYTFGAPRRDPRTRVITVAYYALVDAATLDAALPASGGILAYLDVPWEGETGGPVSASGADRKNLRLAFDHQHILGAVVKRLRGKLDYSPIGYELLPERFTLRDLQRVHETILGRPLNKDSFRRRMLATGELESTGEREQDVRYRPAELYRVKNV